jgi:hypothetical protein
MKKISYVLVVLFATCAATSAQTGPTGTWRVEGEGAAFPWEVVLRVDGPRLTGMVNKCAPRRREIFDGGIDGKTLTFKCMRADGLTTITFTGTINGDEIAFAWKLELPEGSAHGPVAGKLMFGPLAPPRFVAKRVPDGELAKENDATRGVEFGAVVNLVKEDVKVDGMLFVPQKVSRVRAVIVTPYWGFGVGFYDDPNVRRLLETTDCGILLANFSNIGPSLHHDGDRFAAGARSNAIPMLLQRVAEESGHPEVKDAPLLLFGYSVSGLLPQFFALAHPQRTIAAIGYTGGFDGDMTVVSHIPMLVVVGGKDPANDGTSEILWKKGRAAGAPWTYAVQADAGHGGDADFIKATELMVPWISAVLRQRLPTDDGALRAVTDGSAWLGNNQTGEIAPVGSFAGSKTDASWLPDEQTARAWRTVIGAAK